MNRFSLRRLWALIIKEFRQFKRDHTTFAMVISLPIVQLILFGLAINTNPKYLASALVNFDDGPFSRTLIHGLENTSYFKFDHYPASEVEAFQLMRTHKVLFTLLIPPDFSKKLIRGEKPQALLEVDGTDPVSVNAASAAANALVGNVYQFDLRGPLSANQIKSSAELIVHTKYNPNAITQYNIVPGLLGTVLTMTFVLVASMALTRERERGTMESLLTTPITPLEVIIGKATPYIIVGYLQVVVVMLLSYYFFHVPMLGNPFLLLILTLPFIMANLFVGIMISTLAKSQLEASQIGIFFFLPSMLLSGFAFPFSGMPTWAQIIGNILPMTHFINIVRGIMLKGIGIRETWVDLWPILLFTLVMLGIALKRYKQTLD